MYMWRDVRGHFHCIWHNTGHTSSRFGPYQEGAHSFSVDGRDPWYCVDGKGGHGYCTPDTPAPYNTTLYHYVYGGSTLPASAGAGASEGEGEGEDAEVIETVMGTRERPHMLFANDGSPLALVTATRYCNGSRPLCASDVPPGFSDRSFTSVALLRQDV
jgi:hypothetical protein